MNIGAFALQLRYPFTMLTPTLNVTAFQQDFETLRQFGLQADGAVHRVGYSDVDMAARRWLTTRMTDLGLAVRQDAAGNTIGVYAGQEDLPAIGIGSHTDTVPYGGAFDGALGMVAALAVVEALHAANVRLRHPIELINFAAEEATMAGGTTGSQAMTGIFNMATLDKKAWDGKPVREHLTAAGLAPEAMLDAKRAKGELAAFLELHIEQSDRLESVQLPIAIVDGFVGIRRYAVSVYGVANHAGTTPMDRRDDALVKAAPFINTVRELTDEFAIVATIGDFTVYPGAPNVIPERVDLIVETRGLDANVLDQVAEVLQIETAKLGASFEAVVEKPPVQTDAVIQQALHTACKKLGLATLTMPSGAGHDAMNMSRLCPQGIFFVPSKAGISHSKEEYTTPADCLNGAQVYLEAVLALDALLD